EQAADVWSKHHGRLLGLRGYGPRARKPGACGASAPADRRSQVHRVMPVSWRGADTTGAASATANSVIVRRRGASAAAHACFQAPALGHDGAEDGEHDLLVERRIGLTRQTIRQSLLGAWIVNRQAHDLLPFTDAQHHLRALGQDA